MESLRKESLEWIKAIAVGFGLFLIIQFFFFTNYEVEGRSMNPTLQDGDKLVINKITYRLGDVERFDIVVFHANEDEDYVKRVIGVPGDTIEYKEDQLYVNGTYYEEPYLFSFRQNVYGKLTNNFTLKDITGFDTVPEGYVFVLGDNRRESFDSRHFGLVPMEKIVGKVNIRYWPFEQWQFSFGNKQINN